MQGIWVSDIDVTGLRITEEVGMVLRFGQTTGCEMGFGNIWDGKWDFDQPPLHNQDSHI